MTRRLAIPLALVVLAAIVLGGIALAGSGDDETAPGAAPRDAAETPTATPPPRGAGALPPEFFQCLAEQGVEIESPDEIHSLPPQALQACFGSLHQGGGAP